MKIQKQSTKIASISTPTACTSYQLKLHSVIFSTSTVNHPDTWISLKCDIKPRHPCRPISCLLSGSLGARLFIKPPRSLAMRATSISSLFVSLLLYCLTSLAQNIAQLQEQLQRSNVPAVFPNDPGYANASAPFNMRFSFSPIAIAFPETSQQVAASINAGTAQDLKVVARSGGHSYIANGLGGKSGSLVLDLSRMKAITYDEETKTVKVETGNRLGDIALALNDHGRAMPHGRCTYVGIGGHAGHGGFGFQSRMWGLTLDVVQSVTVVLANGTIATVSENENAELFWNTMSVFVPIPPGHPRRRLLLRNRHFNPIQTFPAPSSATIFNYGWTLDISDASKALSNWQSFVDTDIPPEFGGELVLSKGPSYGQVQLSFFGAYWGSFDTFNSTIAPFKDTLPIVPQSQSVTSGNWFEGLEALVFGALNTSSASETRDTFYAKSLLTPEEVPMTEDAVGAFITYLGTEGFSSNTSWFVEVELYGGTNSAINKVPLDETAFAHRSARFNFQLYASSANKLPPYPDFGFTFVDGMANSITSNMPDDWAWGAYVNYADDRLADWQDRYYGSHYERLQALKRSVDPHDVFYFPESIEE
ncbi:hypothetical protein D9758_013863 [Tetrapyrgos nigripes]|uniref:FAD-binding PCMH-type domain-containing protein n=1 Tax=Tetrapyrgos nigripes TaxID=182062 RepID=A0A8H5CQG0_9AGAR|nr:hypothetical protein D9758_013863 [Tetrapyrgos nigripes]